MVPGGPGQSPTYQSPGTGAAPEAAEGGAGAQVPKSGEGEEGREAEGQGGGGRTPGSLVLMKETQETGPEIPPGKLVFPSLQGRQPRLLILLFFLLFLLFSLLMWGFIRFFQGAVSSICVSTTSSS